MKEIKDKARYCLNCKITPCSIKGCPLGNQIPKFIEQIKEENYQKAYEILAETTVLQGVCGRICPHKKQCQGSCVRGVKGEPVSIRRFRGLYIWLYRKRKWQFIKLLYRRDSKK